MGTIAVTNLDNQIVGAKRVVRGTGAFSASYASPGGDTFDLKLVGLNRLDNLLIGQGQGVLARWNGSATAPLVQAYRDVTPAATANFVEVANAVNLSAVNFQFEAIGAG